ncbi:hypothetical protein PVAP13_7KG022678 [Panicum virgatum]|uniref:Uncharacterized protein n=1 Tax=Panicum virgatum TaxID=38727 RepID=A0A8T0QBC8_PANVG|nr:hypothetical protein PVAP13_7KG022678 [Panicum virgatum]
MVPSGQSPCARGGRGVGQAPNEGTERPDEDEARGEEEETRRRHWVDTYHRRRLVLICVDLGSPHSLTRDCSVLSGIPIMIIPTYSTHVPRGHCN